MCPVLNDNNREVFMHALLPGGSRWRPPGARRWPPGPGARPRPLRSPPSLRHGRARLRCPQARPVRRPPRRLPGRFPPRPASKCCNMLNLRHVIECIIIT